MKITPVSNPHQVKNYGKVQSAYSAEKTNSGGRMDEVQLSDTAKTFASAVKSVKDQMMDMESRQQKIDRISAEIKAGTYHVDSDKVAAKILGVYGEGR